MVMNRRLLIVYTLLFSWYVFRVSAVLIAGSVVVHTAINHVSPLVFRQASDTAPFLTPIVITPVPLRMLFAISSWTCTLVMGAIFGSRIAQLSSSSIRRITFINALVLIVYLIGVIYVLSANLILSANVNRVEVCRFATYWCGSLYCISKGALQMYLVERLHAIRSHQMSRLNDYLYIGFAVAVGVCFGGCFVAAMILPVTEVSGIDGFCRIGLALPVLLCLIGLDMIFNAALTGVFIWLLQPLTQMSRPRIEGIMLQRRLSFNVSAQSEVKRIDRDGSGRQILIAADEESIQGSVNSTLASIFGREQPTSTVSAGASDHHPRDVITGRSTNWLDKLIRKSILGTILLLLPTLMNLGFMARYEGRERGIVCLLACPLDVTVSMLILHWLTLGSREDTASQKS